MQSQDLGSLVELGVFQFEGFSVYDSLFLSWAWSFAQLLLVTLACTTVKNGSLCLTAGSESFMLWEYGIMLTDRSCSSCDLFMSLVFRSRHIISFRTASFLFFAMAGPEEGIFSKFGSICFEAHVSTPKIFPASQ